MGELEAAEEAADVAARQARRELRDKRKAEVHANVDERVGKLKEKLQSPDAYCLPLAETRRPAGFGVIGPALD
jgi:hypothetical protein